MASPSWLPIPADSHFSLANIPFGIITTPTSPDEPHPAIAIGEHALDLSVFAANNGFDSVPALQPHLSVFSEPTLNSFAGLGRPVHAQVRGYLQQIFAADTPFASLLRDNDQLRAAALFPLSAVTTHLPLRIGDYTDFYAGRHHAFNVGCLFRGPENALQPNYSHLPVGYHGRASSVVVSGTPIHRPQGQILADPAAQPKVPVFGPSRKLDLELELGAFVCRPNQMGRPVPVDDAHEAIFGFVLMNDWSARDIQAWEYVPLGPFNSKNFGTTVSAWVVLADALEPFRKQGLKNETDLLPYLRERRADNLYDINLEVDLTVASGAKTTITRTNALNLLFSFPQMLSHHTITGCPMNVGDLIGSGTISGPDPGTEGSLLEQSLGGKKAVPLADGSGSRAFLEDGDRVTIRGWCGNSAEGLVGFGECFGTIEPAL